MKYILLYMYMQSICIYRYVYIYILYIYIYIYIYIWVGVWHVYIYIMPIHRGQPLTVNWRKHRPIMGTSLPGFRPLSPAWRTSLVNFMLTLPTTSASTERCWTSRPDWSMRLQSTGDCWMEMRGDAQENHFLNILLNILWFSGCCIWS